MKRYKPDIAIVITLAIFLLLALMAASCATTKKDCRGVKHYKLKNGIYL